MNGNTLDLASEKVVLEVPHQRDTCCHSGGYLQFGPEGNLWISIGDDTSPSASDGFTPIDERAGRSAYDAPATIPMTASPSAASSTRDPTAAMTPAN